MNSSASILGNTNAVRCELVSQVLRSSGTLRLQVAGWSMLPTIWPGDMLVIEPVNKGDVCEGDIVLFSNGRQFVAHRLVTNKDAHADGRFQAQGDAVACADFPMTGSDLIGRVALILRNGKCIEPSPTLRFRERAVGCLMKRSTFAARVVARVHRWCHTSQSQSTHQTSQVQNS